MRSKLLLVVLVAVFPCWLCQSVQVDTLCNNTLCAVGEKCRLLKPCDVKENCSITAICTRVSDSQPSCKIGDPILYMDNTGQMSDLPCYTGAPCPSNAYCSTVLQDVGAVCCVSDPAPTVKPGSCPNIPYDKTRRWCVDGCRHDGDCYQGEKCCFTGCSKGCTPVDPQPSPAPTTPIAPPPPMDMSADPCAGKTCPEGRVCRIVKPCGPEEKCNITTECLVNNSFSRPYCEHGEAILTSIHGLAYDYLSCYTKAPCPGNAYCSTVLMDVGSACCLSDPAKTTKKGTCPNIPYDPTLFFCVDQCKSDGDCHWNQKCCFGGCSKKCLSPEITPPPTPSTPDPPPMAPGDLCSRKVCPTGQTCRVVKPCGPEDACNLTTICADAASFSTDYCLHGNALLSFTPESPLDYLTCYTKAPCPDNAYCSTALMDVASACCLSDPAQTVKEGNCPNIPYDKTRFFCVDQCKSDGDCDWDEKCCFAGCSKECLPPERTPPPTPSTPNPPPFAPGDLCTNKVCPMNHKCRVIKPCGEQELCNLQAICTAVSLSRPYCKKGDAILMAGQNASLSYLPCYTNAPCPDHAYCSTRLMDVGSACCPSNPEEIVKDGICPPPAKSSRVFCVDECVHDGDCDHNGKCCHTGCSKQCTAPIPPPVIDPCDIQLCDYAHYCRRKGMPCRTPWNCRPEGSCIPCETVRPLHPRFGFQLISDTVGCPVLVPIKRPERPTFFLNNPITRFLMWLYQYEA